MLSRFLVGTGWVGVAALLVIAIGSGCGQGKFSTVTLEGAVSIDGAPLDQGTISFTPKEADRGTGVVADIRAGKYRAEGVPLGRVLVQFQAMKETGKTYKEFGVDYPETISVIPAKYDKGIEITVTEDSKTNDFEMSSK